MISSIRVRDVFNCCCCRDEEIRSGWFEVRLNHSRKGIFFSCIFHHLLTTIKSLLVILFLLLLHLSFVRCMLGDITAVDIRLLRWPWLRIAWRGFPFSQCGSEPLLHTISQAYSFNISRCVSTVTLCGPLFTNVINEFFALPDTFSWSHIHSCRLRPCISCKTRQHCYCCQFCTIQAKCSGVNGVFHHFLQF